MVCVCDHRSEHVNWGSTCTQGGGKKCLNPRLKVQLRERCEFPELKIHPLKDKLLKFTLDWWYRTSSQIEMSLI